MPLISRRRASAVFVGAALAIYGAWALLAIPRGLREFQYQNPAGGNALWPLPFAPLNGFTPEQLSSHVARVLLLFPACVLLGYALPRLPQLRVAKPNVVAIIMAATLATAGIAVFVIRSVPLQDDEATYLMQADLIARGLVADPAYPPSVSFPEPFTIFTSAGMSGMYLFGEPLVLALGLPWHTPWLGQVALLALTLWCAYRAAARSGDERIALLGTLLLAASPMLTFTSASSLSQVPALAGLALAVLGTAFGGWLGGGLLGTGLGLAFAARPQTAGPVGLALLALYGWRDRRLVAGAVIAGVPWAAAVAFYDQAVMGTPWQLPRAGYTGEMEAYGFGIVLRHYAHTPLKAIALVMSTLVRLNGWALGWPMSLAGPVLWFALGRPHRGVVRPWGAAALVTFAYQAGYALSGTSETGPIYYYATLPFFAFSTAAALAEAGRRRWGAWAQSAAVMSLLLGTTTFYVEHGIRLSRLSAAIEGPRRSLPLKTPALLFEEVWPARPQIGWVYGVPFRERSPSSLVVRYPRPTREAQLKFLTNLWKGRTCSYLWYDWPALQYRLSPCEETGTRDAESARNRAPADDGRPWYENGGWKDAFPYLPGIGLSRPH